MASQDSTNIYILSLESLETRYTSHWYNHIPESISNYAKSQNKNVNVVNIVGKTLEDKTTPGAFLDFAGTNIWKSDQLEQVAELFRDNKVKPGDVFLYTDFWNPTVIQLRYMSKLLQIPVKIVGIAHAGIYDRNDCLSQLIGNDLWGKHAELSMFHCFDKVIFATQYHIDLFLATYRFELTTEIIKDKIVRSGFPMEYTESLLADYSHLNKKQQIVFPHRKSPEKQLDIFLDLAKEMPEYNWVVCQDTKLTKDEYHTIMGESKLVFSANLQETLGISSIESIFVNTALLVPDRLSYTEMYDPIFKYDSSWTLGWFHYLENKDKLISRIKEIMDYSQEDLIPHLNKQKEIIKKDFISPDIMYSHLI